MKKICVMAGHINIQYNCNSNLRRSTGAPGEQEANLRIANRLSEILRGKGFEVKQTDGNANCDIAVTSKDWDLFISLHCDANYAGDEGGGFVDYPEPSTDGATAESQRIAKAIEGEYFNHSGIRNVPTRSNANTRYYYMWKSLSYKTPCVIVEMGERQDPHDSVILADTDIVANALGRGICKAFDVAWDDQPTQPPCDAQLNEARLRITTLEKEVGNLKEKLYEANENIRKAKGLLNEVEV